MAEDNDSDVPPRVSDVAVNNMSSTQEGAAAGTALVQAETDENPPIHTTDDGDTHYEPMDAHIPRNPPKNLHGVQATNPIYAPELRISDLNAYSNTSCLQSMYTPLAQGPQPVHTPLTRDPQSIHTPLTRDPQPIHTPLTGDPQSIHTPLAGDPQSIHTPLAGDPQSIHTPLTQRPQSMPTPLAGDPQSIHTPLAGDPQSIHTPLTGDPHPIQNPNVSLSTKNTNPCHETSTPTRSISEDNGINLPTASRIAANDPDIEPYATTYLCPNPTYTVTATCISENGVGIASSFPDDSNPSNLRQGPPDPTSNTRPQNQIRKQTGLVPNPMYVPNIPQRPAFGCSYHRIANAAKAVAVLVFFVLGGVFAGLYFYNTEFDVKETNDAIGFFNEGKSTASSALPERITLPSVTNSSLAVTNSSLPERVPLPSVTNSSLAIGTATEASSTGLGDLKTLRIVRDTPKPAKYADCGQINRGPSGPIASGVYTIYPLSPAGGTGAPLRVYCRVVAGRAWTVIQRRQDGSVDFYKRTLEDYSRGFGTLTGEFWLGNDNIHLLTNQGSKSSEAVHNWIAGAKFHSALAYQCSEAVHHWLASAEVPK
ncbi:pancreatic polypeptide receptor [Branchiostoma belcheri]|nr:pancreatic polypeptide receptor [Branchiostoma belcheri]